MKFVQSIFLLLLLIGSSQYVYAQQKPVAEFERINFTQQDSLHLLNEYGKNKKFIPQFTLQTLIALSYYPELKNTHIRFIYKPTHSPLTTRPTFPSILFKKSKRRFTVTISDSTMKKLMVILLRRADFNAQIGILGHEMGHASDFSKRSIFSLAGSGINHVFSSRYIDRFEYRTDSICIAHGLGYQLLSWSSFVRKNMNTKNWEGADNVNVPVMTRERYMNPSTIRKRIAADSLYSK